MLAGLPQNPSYHNPVSNPKRARQRQHQVLARMRALDYIGEEEYQQALAEPLKISRRGQLFATHGEYVAELARRDPVAVDVFGVERAARREVEVQAAERPAAARGEIRGSVE